jgi:peptide/nickel transport system substrate-binding protein
MTRARVPLLSSYRKIDDNTVAITTTTPASYFPYHGGLHPVHVAGLVREGRPRLGQRSPPCPRPAPDRSGLPKSCRARIRRARAIRRIIGTRPRRRRSTFGADADPGGQCEARRLALRPGRLDRSAAARRHPVAQIGRLHHHDRFLSACLAVVLQHRRVSSPIQGREGPPGAELLHRPRGSWCRCSTAPPSPPSAGSRRAIPISATPVNHYTFDPVKGKALLAEAGYTPDKPLTFKAMISNSGSGQMLPLPMNEFLQQNLKEACGVNVEFDVVEWQVAADRGARNPRQSEPQGRHGAQRQLALVRRRHHGALFFVGQLFRRTVSISSSGRMTNSKAPSPRSRKRPIRR